MEKINFKKNDDDLNLEKQKLIDILFANKEMVDELHFLKFDDETIKKNIFGLIDFIALHTVCSKCSGLDFCLKETNKHLVSQIKNKNGNMEIELAPCPYLLKEMILESKFIEKDFPLDYFSNSFKKMDKTSPRLLAFKEFIDYYKNNNFSWLYLKGVSRVGKTYFAATLAIEFARNNNKKVAFINFKKTCETLSKLYNFHDDDFYSELENIATVSLLVIDNFGDEAKFNIVRDEILLPLLKYRHEHKLYTVFVSHYSINEVLSSYSYKNKFNENLLAISKILKSNIKKEINLGDLSIY